MRKPSQVSQGQSTFADKIFGINPYSKADRNHDLWEAIAQIAAEEEAQFEAELLKRTPVTSEEYSSYVQDGMIGHFDILANRLLVFKFRSAESIAIYEDFLTKMMESMLTTADERCPPSIPKAPFLFALHRQFRQRIAHWTALALKRMREAIAAERVSRSEATPSRETERNSFVMPILCEKGWSSLDLAKESEVDFHTVQGYLSGKRKSYSSTLKKLAKALDVSVDDLPK
jgi:DNA-binding Xre family transcriptional regulator